LLTEEPTMPASLPGYLADPWNVPVPVTPGAFTPLKRSDARFNVQVDRVPAFSFDGRRWKPRELLYADLQTNADANIGKERLGSGRAGFFAGRYLKGIGRTPLAGNWNDHRDLYHSSGHLLPSAAAREYLVSRFVEARGLGATINPCNGLLVARAPVERLVRRMFERGRVGPTRMAACDLRLTALSTKDGHFARMSNFVWSLNHTTATPDRIGNILMRLCLYLQPQAQPSLASLTPTALTALLSQSVDKALANFAGYLRLGIHWGSLHNNFTIDGRFLDLEVPVVFGRPFLGILSPNRQRPRGYDGRRGEPIVGLEVLSYFAQMASFIRFLRHKLRHLLHEPAFMSRALVRFLQDFLEALSQTFNGAHVVFNSRQQERTVVAMLDAVFALSRAQKAALGCLVRRRRLALQGRTGGPLQTTRLARLDVHLAKAEPAFAPTAYSFVDLGGTGEPLSRDAVVLNDALTRIEQVSDPDRFLEAVTEAERQIERSSRS
jgi:hypothetical protein